MSHEILLCLSFALLQIKYLESASTTYPFPVLVLETENVEVSVLPQYNNKSETCNVFHDPYVNRNFTIASIDDKFYPVGSENSKYQFIGGGICGIKIIEASSSVKGEWKFQGFGNESRFNALATVNVFSKPIASKLHAVTIGSTKSIDCTTTVSDTTEKVNYCRIYDNKNVKRTDLCTYKINPVKQEDVGNWTCILSIMSSINEQTSIVILQPTAGELIEGKVNNTESKVILSCALKYSTYAFEWCRAVAPDGRKIQLTPGLFDEKYSMGQTDITKKVCSIEIKQPISKGDAGLWRLDIGNSEDHFTGCFLTVSGNNVAYDEAKVNTEVENISAMDGEPVRFHCSVPWPASYCYVRTPTGELIKDTSTKSDHLLKAGNCVITTKKIFANQTGTWVCGLSSNDNTEDVLFEKNVIIFNRSFNSVNRNITPTFGLGANLLCVSALRTPLKYCRFTSPLGKGYTFDPDTISNSRMKYWGKGFDQGECGVKIDPFLNEDVGTWTCATTFVSNNVEEYDTIYIEKPATSQAFTIGMSIGAVVVVTSLVVLGSLTYRRKKLRRNRQQLRTPSNTPPESPPLRRTSFPLHTINTPVMRTVSGSSTPSDRSITLFRN